jgi:flagellar basal body L-ring protein FlgH
VPGVFRPSTLADVLNTIQQQAIGDTDTSVSGVGYIAEADESVTCADSATLTVQGNPAWQAGYWGSVVWS